MLKRLLEIQFEKNNFIKPKYSKYIVKKILPSLLNMQTYSLGCKNHTNNIGSKK